MADTVITTPSSSRDTDASVAGWLVALAIVVVIVLGAAYLIPRLMSTIPAAPVQDSRGIDVDVRLPEGVVPGTNSGQQNSGSGMQGGGSAQPGATQ